MPAHTYADTEHRCWVHLRFVVESFTEARITRSAQNRGASRNRWLERRGNAVAWIVVIMLLLVAVAVVKLVTASRYQRELLGRRNTLRLSSNSSDASDTGASSWSPALSSDEPQHGEHGHHHAGHDMGGGWSSGVESSGHHGGHDSGSWSGDSGGSSGGYDGGSAYDSGGSSDGGGGDSGGGGGGD